MAIFNLPDHVVANIFKIVDKATIVGAEATAIVEIKQALMRPVNPDVKAAPKKPEKIRPEKAEEGNG